MPLPKSKNTVGLGRAIINKKAKEAQQANDNPAHTTDLESKSRLNSVTQERDLDEFLNTAQLAGTEFVAEKQNIKIIQAPSVGASSAHNPFLLSTEEERQALQRHRENKSRLRVPRRPPWTKDTPHAQLERQEKDAFLEWRRGLAELQETEGFLLTPFERNLEVWRQLWRVLERSHLVVQIVDARNPLRFRCEDLEDYVQYIEGAEGKKGTGRRLRKSLLLINKADLLTREQRRLWADYFDEQNVTYAFFSAANAVAVQEAARLREAEAQQNVDGVPPDEDEGDDMEDGDEANSSDPDVDLEIEDRLATDLETAGRLERHSIENEEQESSENAYFLPDDMDDEDDTDYRTRVLNVLELEELFMRAAPDLKLFAPEDSPPPKLVVGLVGYPNVGKSSTINSLIGAKKVSVSSTPGKTKHFQTIHLSPSLVLCDCPGLVFPQFATTKADLVCDGVLPIDQLREHTGPVTLVVKRIPREIFAATYGLAIRVRGEEDGRPQPITAEDLLIPYAVARGFARAGKGEPDEARAARYILKDYVNAKLLFCHPPPGIDAEGFNAQSREYAILRLERTGKKKAPTTRVGKGADNFISPEPSTNSGAAPLSRKAHALDNSFFTSQGLASRPFVQGSALNGQEYARSRLYPHQNKLADDGKLLSGRAARIASIMTASGMQGDGSGRGKKHHKAPRKTKQRSGKGYDD